MADSSMEVKPGDLITAEMWNKLLAQIGEINKTMEQFSKNALQGMTTTVPDVFGRRLSEAKAMLGMPAQQLTMGMVVDASGKIIDPTLQASGALIVISQVPQPGTKVNPGSSVSLAVSSTGGGTGTTTTTAAVTPPSPKIKGFQPNPAPVGSEVLIGGEAFAPDPKDNIVTFDGVKADVPSKSTGNTLLVIVPKGIPNAPVNPGDKTRPDVPVVVRVGNLSGTGLCDISAPISEKAPPHIDTINPAPTVLNAEQTGTITINGSNFSTDVKGNTVRFSGLNEGVNPDTAKEAQLVVTIPKGLSALISATGQAQSFNVTVTTDAGTSNTKVHGFVRIK